MVSENTSFPLLCWSVFIGTALASLADDRTKAVKVDGTFGAREDPVFESGEVPLFEHPWFGAVFLTNSSAGVVQKSCFGGGEPNMQVNQCGGLTFDELEAKLNQQHPHERSLAPTTAVGRRRRRRQQQPKQHQQRG
jgi:hypothetical protein